jgi:hypothetical protein
MRLTFVGSLYEFDMHVYSFRKDAVRLRGPFGWTAAHWSHEVRKRFTGWGDEFAEPR